MQVHLLAKHISKSDDEIERAITRPTYFNPYEAVDFGIIDKVGNAYLVLLYRVFIALLLPADCADLHRIADHQSCSMCQACRLRFLLVRCRCLNQMRQSSGRLCGMAARATQASVQDDAPAMYSMVSACWAALTAHSQCMLGAS